jgi:ABC-type branched-subunit amino acid transport system substrate-binding protein
MQLRGKNMTGAVFIATVLMSNVAAKVNAAPAATPVIGYGSSDAVLPAKNQELFYMGFELALRSALDKRYGHDVLGVSQVSDGSQLGSVRAAKELIAQGAKFLVGFPTSHEALLAADVAIKAPMLIISSGAGHEKLAKLGNHVFTTGESMDYSVGTMMDFISVKYKNEKGLLISNSRAIFSLNQADTAHRLTKASGGKLLPNMEFADVNAQSRLPDDMILKIQSGQYKYLFLTMYADESAHLLQQLEDRGIDLPIISNTSWTTGDVMFLLRLLTRRKSETFSAALWVPGSPESAPMERLIKKTYGRDATAEMAYGYDLGIIVAKTMNGVKDQPTAENIQKSFLGNKCFSDLSSGQLCFHPNGGHADRKIYFVQFLKDHFVPIKINTGSHRE